MGRSVSYASGAAWVLYAHDVFPESVECWDCEGMGHDHEGSCEDCGGTGEREPDWDDNQQAWSDFVGNLTAEFRAAFPSLDRCDEWLGREDHAILENGHVYIGVSEYCGLVSVWCKPKEGYYGEAPSALAEHWAASIENKAEKLVDSFASRLVKLGHMSNGEGVYRRAAA